MRGFSIGFDTLAPPRCIECEAAIGRDGARALCRACHARLPWWRRADGCPRCGALPLATNASATPTHAFPHPTDALPLSTDVSTSDAGERARFEGCAACLAAGSALHRCHALVRYEGALRRWIPGFKSARGAFGPSTPVRLAIEHLADALAARVARETAARPDVVVGVPAHRRRRRARGFDHAGFLARRVARGLGRPTAPGWLERVRDTPPQATLVGRARETNVRRAFRALVPLGGFEQVWLVDDVLTTGSTLEAAAEALLDAGALEVRALTLAATLPGPGAHRRRRAYHQPPSIGR